MSSLLSPDLSHLILTVRGHRVIIDADLAKLYGVSTKVFNQAVKRNKKRFPLAFMFQFTKEEVDLLWSQIATTSPDQGMRSQIVTASKRNIRFLPYAFTEYGALMAANVLNSSRAVSMSVEIVMAFVRFRRMTLSVEQLAHKIHNLEQKYDGQFKIIFDAVRQLMIPPDPPKRKIGFNTKEE